MLDCKRWWVPNRGVLSRCKSQNATDERLWNNLPDKGECAAWSRSAEVTEPIWSPALQSSNLPSQHRGRHNVARVCECVLWLCEIVFPMTDREMLTVTSQPIPIKTRRLWLMALLVCGFAQMGLHLSQDPCCLHSDPQRMVIQQLSFVNVRFFFLVFLFFVCFVF